MKKNEAERVLVTGGAGFIGANLVRRLVKDRFKVHILQKKSSNYWRLKGIERKIVIHNESLLDRKALHKLLKKINPKVIYHLAAHGSYPNQRNVEKIVKNNILGTLNLLLASRDIPYKCFINTGSSSEYGIKSKPMRESDICQPISFYAASKLSATALCQVFAKVYNKPIFTLRPFSVYGPYEKDSRFIPTIMRALIDKKAIKLTPGEQRRDFIYVDDVIDAYLKISAKARRLSKDIFNIGTGCEFTNDELVQTSFKVVGKQTRVVKGAFKLRPWDTPHWVADISRTRKCLNWKPKYSLAEGLLGTFKWFKKFNDDKQTN